MTLYSHQAAALSIIIPIVAGATSHLIAKIPKKGAILAKSFCILASCLTLFLVFILALATSQEPIKAQIFTISLLSTLVNVGLYVDFLALVPALISSSFTTLALIYNVNYLSPSNKAYEVGSEFNRSYSFILAFNGAMLGTLFSSSLFSLIIFWELVSLCSYALISFWNEDQLCLRASFKCFIMTHIGTIALLMATIIIYFITGTLEISEIGQKIPLGDHVIWIIFPLLLIAVLPKTVLFPLHTWLPDGTVAPTSATVVFHVCGFQSGIYIIIRFFFQVFRAHVISAPAMPLSLLFGNISIWSFIISLIGTVTHIVGALNGLVENDFKRIVAYGTISGLGCIVMVAGLATPLCTVASLFLMMSHALCFGLLFLCAGIVIYATGRHNINEMGGLYHQMPISAICCMIGVLSLSTVPLLSEFASKYLILHATINSGAIFFTIIAFLGCVLNTAIGLRLLHSVFMQRTAKSALNFQIKDPPIAMLAPLVLISVVLVIFGIAPMIPLGSFITPAVKQIGFPVDIIMQLWLIKTLHGFWNPMAVAISMLALFLVFVFMTLYSRKIVVVYRESASEETFKPFLCGEDSNLLDNPHGYHFYHTLTRVLKIEWLCHATNVDRAYDALSTKFSGFCAKLLRLDIQQGYFGAVLTFVLGAMAVVVIAILFGG